MENVQHISHEKELWVIIEWALIVIVSIGGVLIKMIWSRQSDLSKEQTTMWKHISNVELNIANTYVKDNEFKEAIASLKLEFHDTINPLCLRVSSMDNFLRKQPPPHPPS
jgi:hypothetical protein